MPHRRSISTSVPLVAFIVRLREIVERWAGTEYNNIPKLVDDGLDSLSILVILKTLEMWAQKGYELFQPIAPISP